MSNGEVTAVLGALSVLVTLGILVEFWYGYVKTTRKSTRRADAFWKAVVDTQGRKSYDDIMRAVTKDYRGGVDDNQVLDLLVTKYKDVTIQQLEQENPFAGKYNPKAQYNVNANQLNDFYMSHQDISHQQAAQKTQERDFADLAALDRLIAQEDARAANAPPSNATRRK